MANLSNATPERFYNSFEGAVWLNVALAVLGPLFIAIIIPIFICCLGIKKNRQGIKKEAAYTMWGRHIEFLNTYLKVLCSNF